MTTTPIVLEIRDWMPCSENEFTRHTLHWSKRNKLKADDRDAVHCATYLYQFDHGSIQAKGKRRVSLEYVFPKSHRGRRPDPTNLEKSLLDAMKHAGLIVDDDYAHCEMGEVKYSSGPKRMTRITLEDV